MLDKDMSILTNANDLKSAIESAIWFLQYHCDVSPGNLPEVLRQRFDLLRKDIMNHLESELG